MYTVNHYNIKIYPLTWSSLFSTCAAISWDGISSCRLSVVWNMVLCGVLWSPSILLFAASLGWCGVRYRWLSANSFCWLSFMEALWWFSVAWLFTDRLFPRPLDAPGLPGSAVWPLDTWWSCCSGLFVVCEVVKVALIEGKGCWPAVGEAPIGGSVERLPPSTGRLGIPLNGGSLLLNLSLDLTETIFLSPCISGTGIVWPYKEIFTGLFNGEPSSTSQTLIAKTTILLLHQCCHFMNFNLKGYIQQFDSKTISQWFS